MMRDYLLRDLLRHRRLPFSTTTSPPCCARWATPLVPLLFLAVSRGAEHRAGPAVCASAFRWGVAGAAAGHRASRSASPAVGIAVYTRITLSRPARRSGRHMRLTPAAFCGRSSGLSLLTCIQQSVMNFGILMVQGLVNSFGTVVMAAFAAAVKIDSFAYMPVQDFGNAFSTFIAQNYGAGKAERIRRGIRSAVGVPRWRSAWSSPRWCASLRRSLDAAFRPAGGDGDPGGGRAVPAHRGRLLLRASAACFCSTASTARCAVRASRWCSPSSRWAHGWCWPTCWPPFRPSGWWGSGGPSRSAGCLPTWRGCSTTKSLKSSCWNNCKKSKKRPGKGSLFLCLLGGSSL